jgi:four helix bundle protein
MVKSYKDLEVWKKSIELVKQLYLTTENFPTKELYGLTSQMRRAAISIPSNIAEGKARQYSLEFVRFLYVALGSCAELETQLIIAMDLGYAREKTVNAILESLDHIGKMLTKLIKTIRPSNNENRKANSE